MSLAHETSIGLALLRMNYREAAEEALGVKIKVCPAAVPPRVPAPVRRERESRVLWFVSGEACGRTMQERFAKLRVGMTLSQLLTRGITKRDIRVWRQRGILEMSS
jgi:hypothetical protein